MIAEPLEEFRDAVADAHARAGDNREPSGFTPQPEDLRTGWQALRSNLNTDDRARNALRLALAHKGDPASRDLAKHIREIDNGCHAPVGLEFCGIRLKGIRTNHRRLTDQHRLRIRSGSTKPACEK